MHRTRTRTRTALAVMAIYLTIARRLGAFEAM